MLSGSDLSEVITDLMIEPLGGNGGAYKRTEEAAKALVSETYAANLAAETLPAVRMLHWNDMPAAVDSMMRYPADLGRAQLQAWLAWLNFVDKQCALLCGLALNSTLPTAVQRQADPKPAKAVDHKVVPLAVRTPRGSRTLPRASVVM